MRNKITWSALLVLALSFSSLSGVSAAPADQAMNQYVYQAVKQKLIKKTDSKKAEALASSACRNSAQAPNNYYPDVTSTAVLYNQIFASSRRNGLKINNRKMRQLIGLAVNTVCPATQISLNVPVDGWQEFETGQFATTFRSMVTEGALLPLGNAWELGGELEGYVTSGKWFESAFFKLEMLDENLQPVIQNYASSTGIDLNRPLFDNPILQNSDWTGGYSAGREYSPIGSGSGKAGLSTWANARYARVVSLTGTSSALMVLRAQPQGWIRSQ